ncbi:MAG: P-loop NTPase fold protein [Candidatus Zixiibacteriota bacterium]
MGKLKRQGRVRNSIIPAVKATLTGLLIGEALLFGLAAGDRMNFADWFSRHVIASVIACCVILTLLFAYLSARGFIADLHRKFRSGRLDLALALLLSFILDFKLGGISAGVYKNLVSLLAPSQLLLLLSFLLVVVVSYVFRVIYLRFRRQPSGEPSYFLSDEELFSSADDRLGYDELAKKFSERVLNNGATSSIVFGIDAPWGIGKSTFVNFCKEQWRKTENRPIVYPFSPLQYQNDEELTVKFIDGLVRAILSNSYVPEIRPLVSRYARFVRGIKGSLSIFGLEVVPGNYTIDEAYSDLRDALRDFGKKIIVVIDDLDRVDLTAVKAMLFTLKRSFALPNITYVLCYDTANLGLFDQEQPSLDTVTEFLEKFVNVKISLYIDSKLLEKYVKELTEEMRSINPLVDPKPIEKALGGMEHILRSPEFHEYVPFIGDVRKVKRLINTLLLLEIEKTDFDNSDFDSQDLIHLLLIYVNYPKIFRKIYYTETQERRGFFSAVLPTDEWYPTFDRDKDQDAFGSGREYRNSTKYIEYVENLSPQQRFLLDRVFDISTRLKNARVSRVSDDVRTSFACFNGTFYSVGNKNLEQYLDLIVKMSKPPAQGQHKYYTNLIKRIAEGNDISQILSEDVFTRHNNETAHKLFWRTIVNNARQLEERSACQAIAYILENIHLHCRYQNSDIGLGLRDDLPLSLVYLLDKAGWTDEEGHRTANTDENIAEIAEWVFGEGRHKDQGVITALSNDDRGVLGLDDLLSFRLYSCADRGGDIYNLQRAIAYHGNPDTPSGGSLDRIVREEMREISQLTFCIFDLHYIQKKINIFDAIDQLTWSDTVGEYEDYVKAQIDAGQVKEDELERDLAVLRSSLKSFIVYQLGNSNIDSGIGCGFYDEAGKEDQSGIRKEMNSYLFELCFDPSADPRNYGHFLNYLLLTMGVDLFRRPEKVLIPRIDQFLAVLEKERIAQYWQTNRDSIRAEKYAESDKQIYTHNGIITYRDYLDPVYQVLDKLISAQKEEPADGSAESPQS